MTIDPNTIPVIELTGDEITEAQTDIQNGLKPPEWFDLHKLAKARNTFGHDAKQNRKGEWIEQGFGSSQNMTENSIRAYIKHCSHEPDFDRHLERMRKDLAECQARRAAAAKPQF